MTDQVERLKAALAERYVIERELGSGGMATVYLAQDVRHDRKVAVKVLHPELAAVLGAERFLNEIKVTANLQHPHILPLHDSGEADGFLYYVMPFVEGESLREKLDREKQISIEEAIAITKSVASALDYAHRHEVIHRDIKPENILLHDGQPVVADFGIALAVSAAGGTRLTETGLSLGTPQYMSPEQATGDRAVDGRSDIYSMGCVLYEMLSGEPPHTGPTVQAVIAKVVTDRPRLITELRDTVPIHTAAAVHKALAKLPADRFAAAGEFAESLAKEGAVTYPGVFGLPESPAVTPKLWYRLVPAALALLGIGATIGWLVDRKADTSAASVDITRFAIQVEGPHEMSDGESPRLAISPDGRRVAYGVLRELYVRSLDGFESLRLAGTQGAENPFFSPDGMWLGFVQNGTLKKISVDGGPVTELMDEPVSFNSGPYWSEDGTILYAKAGGKNGIWRVPATGGVSEQITVVSGSEEDMYHFWPQLLDDGRLVLYTMTGTDGRWEDARIVVQDLETGERKTVKENATYGRYVSTGHIVYADAMGTILAVPFDLTRRTVTGTAIPVESGVRIARYGGAASFAVSDGGTAVFVRGSNAANHLLWWVDRDGTRLDQLGGPLSTEYVRLSPDGSRVAMWIHRQEGPDMWLVDASTGEADRFTFGPGWEWTPVWSPDGRRIAYTGEAEIYVKEIDAETDPVLLRERPYEMWLTSWSPDGRWLAFDENRPGNMRDVYVLQVDSVEYLITIVATPAEECCARFSPDGRWLAYQADGEVYVVSFPQLGAKRQVSVSGGVNPRWSPAGDELFYWQDSTLMVASVSTDGPFVRGPPRPLFMAPDALAPEPRYDVAPDARRFLLRVRNPEAPASEIHVVLNWFEALRRLERESGN